MSHPTERPPRENRTPETADQPSGVDEELRDSLAIRAVFKALDDVSGPVAEHSETLVTLMFSTAHEFFDAAQAERCRLMFENAVKKAGNIPEEAKAVLLELHCTSSDQVGHFGAVA